MRVINKGNYILYILVAFLLLAMQACSDTGSDNEKQMRLVSELNTTEANSLLLHNGGSSQSGNSSSQPQYGDGRSVIVDGYDITAATTGTRLKDAYAGYFTVGVAINGSQPSNSSIKSNAMAEIMKYHFSSTTFSNLMKPSYLLDQQGSISNIKSGIEAPSVRFDSIKEGMEYARDNGIGMRGHVLVWHEQAPDWFFREGYEGSRDYVNKETMLFRMESYIKQVMEYTQDEFPDVIYCWDVVNEAVENSDGFYEKESGYEIRTRYHSGENLWYKVIGVDYVEKAFEFARKYADPDVKLFYNDYNTFQPDKTQSIYDLVASLKKKGLVDGIGMQGYMELDYPGIDSGEDNFKEALLTFSELGLQIHITELTIRSRDMSERSFDIQADRYKELFRMLTMMDKEGRGPADITNVTFFALMDDYLFYKGSSNPEYHRLFDGQLQPKPAFYSVLSAIE